MAALWQRAGEIGRVAASFTKTKVIPKSQKQLHKAQSFAEKNQLGPRTELLLNKTKPYIRRASQAILQRAETQAVVVNEKVDKYREGLEPPQAPLQQENDDGYRERYIPMTRKSIVRLLMQKKDFMTPEEIKVYESFAIALDSAIVNKYHGVLQELKFLFDPINPDKDTMQGRKLTPRERQDSEFWLLERLEDVMEKANFHELPQAFVKHAIEEHEVMEGVKVSVDVSKYDVLKFWALGKVTLQPTIPWYVLLKNVFTKNKQSSSVQPRHYYKRVVVAIRFKRDQKLMLKCFKEIPSGHLEMVLPDGKINISQGDKAILATSVIIGTTGLLAKGVTLLAHMNVDWVLLVSGVMAATAIRAWTQYNHKKNKYLADVSRTLYFKNVANNRGLLALLVDRAEDESFKEALLAYTFLLANKSTRSKLGHESVEMSPSDMGGMTVEELQKVMEDWVLKTAETKIEINVHAAVTLLTKFGILSELDGKLHVLPIEAAMRNLPQQPQSLVARANESDISEGYDWDAFFETNEQYQKEEEIQKRVGWF